MAKTISKPTSSTKKKVKTGEGHIGTVEQGEQGRDPEPVVVEVVPETPLTIDELRIIGEDYALTPMIYGEEAPKAPHPTDVLPDAKPNDQDITDPLQLFINRYQPGELVSKNHFRNLLLTILNDWKNRA